MSVKRHQSVTRYLGVASSSLRLAPSCGCSSCSLCALSGYHTYVLTAPASHPCANNSRFQLWTGMTVRPRLDRHCQVNICVKRLWHRVVATMALALVLVVALVTSSMSSCDAMIDCADCAVSAAMESGGLMGRAPILHPNSVQYTIPSAPTVSAQELCYDASYEPNPNILGKAYLMWCALPGMVSSTTAKCDEVKRSTATHLNT